MRNPNRTDAQDVQQRMHKMWERRMQLKRKPKVGSIAASPPARRYHVLSHLWVTQPDLRSSKDSDTG